jgi:hypothetical protein
MVGFKGPEGGHGSEGAVAESQSLVRWGLVRCMCPLFLCLNKAHVSVANHMVHGTPCASLAGTPRVACHRLVLLYCSLKH